MGLISRTPGGYIWAIVEPAAGIALLTVIYSIGFRSPPLGRDFALFYSAGMLPFLMYLDVSNKLAQSLTFSRRLLEYPRLTFLDAMIARLVLNFLTQLLVHFIILGAILVFGAPDTVLDYSKVVLAYVMVLALATGVETLNCFLSLSYPLWQTAWAIVTRPLFLASGIFFIFESIPQPYADYLWFNPLIHIVGMMRDAFYPFYQPTYVSLVYVMGLSGG